MSSRVNREKYRYDGPNASRAPAAKAPRRPIRWRRRYGRATIAVPIRAGGRRAVKSESPSTT
jgi:hypothetical protein